MSYQQRLRETAIEIAKMDTDNYEDLSIQRRELFIKSSMAIAAYVLQKEKLAWRSGYSQGNIDGLEENHCKEEINLQSLGLIDDTETTV
jgi:hypothetical protein